MALPCDIDFALCLYSRATASMQVQAGITCESVGGTFCCAGSFTGAHAVD